MAEEQPALSLIVVPVIEQMASRRSGTDVPSCSPLFDSLTNSIDELVLLNPVLRPVRVKGELLALFLGPSDGDKVRASAPLFYDFVGDAFVRKSKMASGLHKGKIDDWVFDDRLAHSMAAWDVIAAARIPFPLWEITSPTDPGPQSWQGVGVAVRVRVVMCRTLVMGKPFPAFRTERSTNRHIRPRVCDKSIAIRHPDGWKGPGVHHRILLNDTVLV